MAVSAPRAMQRRFLASRLAVVLVAAAAGVMVAAVCGAAAETVAPAAGIRALDERDALIRELMRRLEVLERRMTAVQGAMQELGGGGPARAGKTSVRLPAPARRAAPAPVKEALPDLGDGAPGEAKKKSTPGFLTIDEEAAERALERTLVQAGALLLPPGKAEVQPGFTFVRRKGSAQNFALLADGAVVVAGETEVRRNELEPSLALRVGLPWDAQLELNLPYNVVDQTTVTTVSGQRSKSERWGNGTGDLEVGLAKTVLREGRFRPDLVARIAWDTNSGQRTSNKVALANSVHEVRGSLTALKQQDPLAFFASVTYERPFTEDHIRPGDRLAFGLGTALAASPESSLSIAFNQSFTDDVRARGQVIDGTDETQATLAFGVSTVLSRNVLLSVSAGAGLTEESPDYFVGVSLPVRFDMPVP